ncbi:hypothetical protein LPJ59_001852 [Coemansia sp. RSA 2399]|nr:hypothetical protein LPJ59_001852 [Coemansia sp. RSA 2399]
MDPNSLGGGGGGTNNTGGDLGLNMGLDDIWGMGDSTNLFFNMDAFSSAPASAIGNGSTASNAMMPQAQQQQQQQQLQQLQLQQQPAAVGAGGGGGGGGIDLSSLGFDMGGSSMDPEAWRMLLQGDPSMDDLFGGGGGGGGLTADIAQRPSIPQPPVATLVPADLDALSKNYHLPAPHTPSIKSPAPTAKKPRQTKSKKASSAKGEKSGGGVAAKSKASSATAGAGAASRKGATPKLKSPTPQPMLPVASAADSPSSDSVRRIKPKAEPAGAMVAVPSPTPSTRPIG